MLIKNNRILRKVSLKNNNIGNQGVLAFLGGISSHHKESKFDIRSVLYPKPQTPKRVNMTSNLYNPLIAIAAILEGIFT
jgi:hypothetical protein